MDLLKTSTEPCGDQDEDIFCQLIDLLEKDELEPMTKQEWRDWVRGRRGTQPSHSTKSFDNPARRSETFMSRVLPPLLPFSSKRQRTQVVAAHK